MRAASCCNKTTCRGGAISPGERLFPQNACPEAAEKPHYPHDSYQLSVTGVAANDVLNIRAEPDPHAPKVGEIPPDGTCVRNLGCKGGLTFREFTELSPDEQTKRLHENPRWCRIEYRGTTGWVAGRYLTEGYCSE